MSPDISLKSYQLIYQDLINNSSLAIIIRSEFVMAILDTWIHACVCILVFLRGNSIHEICIHLLPRAVRINSYFVWVEIRSRNVSNIDKTREGINAM